MCIGGGGEGDGDRGSDGRVRFMLYYWIKLEFI